MTGTTFLILLIFPVFFTVVFAVLSTRLEIRNREMDKDMANIQRLVIQPLVSKMSTNEKIKKIKKLYEKKGE